MVSALYEKKEYCGVFGIYSFLQEDVAYDIYLGLMNLQHRGQDSAGFATSDGKKISLTKGLGYVNEVINQKAISSSKGFAGIGHVRYPTVGAGGVEDSQPLFAKVGKKEFALAHNGNISNYGRIKHAMEKKGWKFCSGCDSELILNAFVSAYLEKGEIFSAVEQIMNTLDGSYSVVLMSNEGELVAFRDPKAIRPLCFGRSKDKIAFASESVALDIIKCDLEGDLLPGEVILVNSKGIQRKVVAKNPSKKHCMFEYVYFSRPDSKIDGRWVHEVRKKLGIALAKQFPTKADIIVPVPDTARSAAEGYSEQSKIPVAEGLIKNRYVARTFIMPSQKKRQDAIRLKLNAVKNIVEGKRIILIDDSIVRGNTSGPIVKLLKDAGAKEVHVRITCPPIIGPCFYGIDLPTYEELIAANKSVEEIRKMIGADSLVYQSIEGLIESIGLKKEELCLGCITEDYPTEFGKYISNQMKTQKAGKKGIRVWEENL